MKEYLASLMQTIQFLQKQLYKKDHERRLQIKKSSQTELNNYGDELEVLIKTAMKPQVDYLKGISLPLGFYKDEQALAQQTAMFMNALNELHSCLHLSEQCFRANLNGCGEYATLMFLILYHSSLSQENLIESVFVSMNSNSQKNHNFLLVNRCIDGTLEDVRSWGKNCLVIDPWLGVINSPQDMPIGSSVWTLYQTSALCSLKVLFTNQLGISNTYAQDHLLHILESDINQVLRVKFKELIDDYIKKMHELPWLKLDTVSNTTEYGFFALTDQDKYHKKLESKVRQICKHEYKELLSTIEKKDYALALRQTSAVAHFELIQTLLDFRSYLDFDVNAPSKSNGKTALDWLRENKTSSPDNKNNCLKLLGQAGATSGLVSSSITLY